MKYIRLVYRLTGLVLIQIAAGALGLAAVLALLPFRRARCRAVLYFKNLWGLLCCRVMNIQIRREGDPKQPAGGALIVSNHIGSVDIFVIAACFETFFISKSDVRSWPVIGQLAQLGGTIFIDRARKTQVAAMVREASARLRDGFSVAVFPEGRATPGHEVEPFKPSAFEAVVLSRKPVLPVMIRYFDAGEPSVACWPDGVSFMENMVHLLMHPRLGVRVAVLPEIRGETDRRVLAQTSRRVIAERFGAEAPR